jgi:hypothetical protein
MSKCEYMEEIYRTQYCLKCHVFNADNTCPICGSNVQTIGDYIKDNILPKNFIDLNRKEQRSIKVKL